MGNASNNLPASSKSKVEKFDLLEDGGAGNALSPSYFSPSITVTRRFFFKPICRSHYEI
jgi:hypothetical protein